MADGGEDLPEDYDPHEDPEADPLVRKRIRYEYRELISHTQKNRHEFIKPECPGLHEALDKADTLFKQVKLTREAALDARFMVLASNLGIQQAQQLQTDLVTFDRDVFVEKLITFMGGRSLSDNNRGGNVDDESPSRQRHPSLKLDWRKLGKEASQYFKRTPTLDFMLGPLSMEAPVIRRQRREGNTRKNDKPDLSQKVTPRQLDKVEAQEESTSKEVERLYRILFENTVSEEEEITPFCFFKFVINPHSFSQTVENLFHLSFLIRDGRASITLNENELPVVAIEDMPGTGDEDVPDKNQVILSLNMKDFKEIIEAFDITEPTIPPRRKSVEAACSSDNHINQTSVLQEGEDEIDE